MLLLAESEKKVLRLCISTLTYTLLLETCVFSIFRFFFFLHLLVLYLLSRELSTPKLSMSSMRNAVQRRNHKERGQVQGREKWGLLEKHKVSSCRGALGTFTNDPSFLLCLIFKQTF